MAKTFTIRCTTEEEARRALNADKAYQCLWEIAEEIFRPARKHGYRDPEVQLLLGDKGSELVSVLEKKFYTILEDNGIDFKDYT